jgi:hypothetical protein
MELTPDERNNTPLIEVLEEADITCIIDSLQFHPLYERLISSKIPWISINVLSHMSESENSKNL